MKYENVTEISKIKGNNVMAVPSRDNFISKPSPNPNQGRFKKKTSLP